MPISPTTNNDVLHRHQEIYQDLRAQLEDDRLPPHSRIPTERELSERFQTSRITVVKALSRLTHEGFLERRPGSGTFVTDWRQPKIADIPLSEQVAVLVGFSQDPGSARILRGIAEAFTDDSGSRFLLYDTGNSPEREAESLRRLQTFVARGTIRGIIACPVGSNINEAAYAQLAAAGCSLVFVDRYFAEIPADRVSSDNESGARKVVQDLIAAGHRRIAFLYSCIHPNVVLQDRQAGYERALREADQAVRADWIGRAERIQPDGGPPPNGPMDDCYPLFQRWFADAESPTAIFCANDCVLQSCLLTLRQQGRRVGRDVVLAGFLDRTDWVSHVEEPFLGIRQWQTELGSQAAQLLRDRLTARKTAVPHRHLAVAVDYWHHPSPAVWEETCRTPLLRPAVLQGGK